MRDKKITQHCYILCIFRRQCGIEWACAYYGTLFWPKPVWFHVERSIFLYWTVQIFILDGRDFMLKGQDFPSEWSRFYVGWSRFSFRTVEISWWTVDNFLLNGREFHVERSRFSCWTVQIFMLNGRDFHVERSRFSRWQVMTGWDFHNDRSKITLLLWLKFRSARGASGHLAFSFHAPVSLIYLVDEFFLLLT